MQKHEQIILHFQKTDQYIYPLRTAVASATVAGMIKKELADTASWKRLM